MSKVIKSRWRLRLWGLMVPTAVAVSTSALGQDLTTRSAVDLMATAKDEGQYGQAQKTKSVDARPAEPGEVIVTIIAGEGIETQSRPAEPGDFVVRNRCPETGNEQYLVAATKFTDRYEGPFGDADADGWREFRPLGPVLDYLIVSEDIGSFTFNAPWGEAMIAHPGDAIVQNPSDEADTYRIAALSFACTYEILTAAPEG